MRPLALVAVLLSAAALAAGCDELSEEGSSAPPVQQIQPADVDIVSASFAPPEQVNSCVEQMKFGAYTANAIWTQVWNDVGQTDAGASSYCTQLGTDNPSELTRIHEGWLQLQASLAAVEPESPEPPAQPACDTNYEGCVPIASDVDCEGGDGDGPAYVAGPLRVVGSDHYGLDRDGDGWAC